MSRFTILIFSPEVCTFFVASVRGGGGGGGGHLSEWSILVRHRPSPGTASVHLHTVNYPLIRPLAYDDPG